jgi:hypothetical protein
MCCVLPVGLANVREQWDCREPAGLMQANDS